MLRAMAQSAIHYLKKRGLTDVAIAGQVGCERRAVARVVAQPIDQTYQRRAQPSRLAHWDPTVLAWLDAGLPIKRMLELSSAPMRRRPTPGVRRRGTATCVATSRHGRRPRRR